MDLLTLIVHSFAGGAFVFLIAILLYTQNQLRFVRWCVRAPDAMLRRVDRPTRYVLRFAAAFAIPVEGAVPSSRHEALCVLDGTALFHLHQQLGISTVRFSQLGENRICHLRLCTVPAAPAALIQQIEKELPLYFRLDET